MMNKNAKIIIGVVIVIGVLSLVAIVGVTLYLVSTSTASSGQYYMTVSEVLNKREKYTDRAIRISGAVVGDSIEYNEASMRLSFIIAEVPADFARVEQQGGLAAVLEDAVNDPNRQRIQVVYTGIKPDLLRDMAQAIIAGELHQDSIFYADEILLKCPTKYEEAVPDQAGN
jgi:cytochrome c-type biogenesis protein CcmE